MKQGSRRAAMAMVALLVFGALYFLALMVSWAWDYRELLNFAPMYFGLFGAIIIYGGLVIGPVGRTLGRMLEGDADHDTDLLLSRLNSIEDRLSEISGEVHRVGDFENRIEFAERLLSNQSEREER